MITLIDCITAAIIADIDADAYCLIADADNADDITPLIT